MTYVETSVVLAQLLSEDRCPRKACGLSPWFPPDLQSTRCGTESMRSVSEIRTEESGSCSDASDGLKMMPLVLARAGFLSGPVANALDALHLASVEFVRAHGQDVKLASYDVRVIKAARRLSISLFTLNRSRTLVDTA